MKKLPAGNQARVYLACAALCLVFCLVPDQGCYAQSYIFESPNTRDQMSGEAAVRSLDSFEQKNFAAVAGYLARKLCRQPEVANGLGLFAGSTENAVMVTGCGGRRARYLGELLARYAHQEWVLIFAAEPAGKERLVVISFTSDQPLRVPEEMRGSGLTAGTVIVKGTQAKVYLWEADHAHDAAIRSLAEAHRATIEEIAGHATLIGDDSRARAQRLFDREIAAYERGHQPVLSPLLWSRTLRDLGLSEAGPPRRQQKTSTH